MRVVGQKPSNVEPFAQTRGQRLWQAMLATKEDLRNLAAVIKTYFDYGGKHIQFNVVDKKTLLDAQVHPELHRDLVVRVAGYSALFTDLQRSVQDEIIQRTEYAEL